VPRVFPKRSAISLFGSPRATKFAICFSRLVSDKRLLGAMPLYPLTPLPNKFGSKFDFNAQEERSYWLFCCQVYPDERATEAAGWPGQTTDIDDLSKTDQFLTNKRRPFAIRFDMQFRTTHIHVLCVIVNNASHCFFSEHCTSRRTDRRLSKTVES